MKVFSPSCKILAGLFRAGSCLMLTPMKAQTIQIDSTFTADGEILPFLPNDTIYGLSITGHVTLYSDTSLVRVILTDNAGHEWMVYEAYPFINPNWNFDFQELADETMYREVNSPGSLADTLVNSPGDSIVTILDLRPCLSGEYIKAFEYLKMGDSMNVSSTLDAIPGNYILTSDELIEHALYEDYFVLLFSLDSDDSTNIAMDSSQLALCYNILNHASGMLQGFARNLLIMNDSLDYQEIILLPEPGLKSGKVRRWPVKSQIVENYMKIYPNPAKNVVIIETRLKEEPRDAFINMIDSKGIRFKSYPIQKQNEYLVIPLSDLQSGILLCQLILRNKIVETRKLIVVK